MKHNWVSDLFQAENLLRHDGVVGVAAGGGRDREGQDSGREDRRLQRVAVLPAWPCPGTRRTMVEAAFGRGQKKFGPWPIGFARPVRGTPSVVCLFSCQRSIATSWPLTNRPEYGGCVNRRCR